MLRTDFVSAALAVAVVAGLSMPAEAIIRRHDLDDQAYLDFAGESQFDSVGRVLMQFEEDGSTFWNGSGTLIGDRWVLTAAHVVDDESVVNWRFDFGGGTERYDAKNVFLHPDWTGGIAFEGAADMALIELDRPVEGYTPVTLSTTVPTAGTEIAAIGYGGTGDGIDGWDGGYDLLKRAGTNVLEGDGTDFPIAPDLLTWDFDEPTAKDSEATALEAMGVFGDSGGALMTQVDGQWELIGVHSFISTQLGDEGIYGIYGDWTTSTSVYAYQDWIASIVPAPGSVLLLAFGGFIGTRRRR